MTENRELNSEKGDKRLNKDNQVVQKNFKEIIVRYSAYYPLFIIFLSLSILLTYLKIHFQIPQYSTSIKVLIKDARIGGAEAKILSEVLSSGRANLSNEVEILKSATLMKRVVLKLALNTVCIYQGKFRNTEIYDSKVLPPLVFEKIGDSSKPYNLLLVTENKGIWCNYKNKKYILRNHEKSVLSDCEITVNFDNLNNAKKLQKYFVSWTPTSQMASMIAGGVSAIALNKEATIISLSHTSENIQKSQDILNTLADEYDQYNIEQKNRSLDNSIKFVDDRLYFLSKDLNDVEDSLLNYKEKNEIVNIESQSSRDIGKIDNLKEKTDEFVVKAMLCDMVSQYVNNSQRRFNLIPSTLGIEDFTLTELIQLYNKNVLKREELIKTLPKGNLEITSLESELDGLRIKIIEAIKNIKTSYESKFQFINKKIQFTNDELRRIPIVQKNILEIEREQGIKEKLYIYLLEKKEETGIAKASAISSSNPIDPAVSSGNIGPSSASLYTIAVLIGLGLPILLIFIKETLNDKIRTKQDIVGFSNVPVIGEVSHYKTRSNSIIATNSRGLIAEQFRLLRTNLQYFISDADKGTILITSTMKGEGKTFVSMNLGSILAVAGKKTILLEFDLRKPRVSKALGIENEVGISSYLTGNHKIEDLIKSIPNSENLWMLPSGPVPPNPAELLLSKKVNTLFSELKNLFDYIIIDTPPIGIVSDARILAKFSDLNFYIIRQRFTLKTQMEFIDTLYTKKVLPNMALIVNDVVNEGTSSYYGYGKENYIYGGYYGYAYGYGYYDDEKHDKSRFNKIFKRKDS